MSNGIIPNVGKASTTQVQHKYLDQLFLAKARRRSPITTMIKPMRAIGTKRERFFNMSDGLFILIAHRVRPVPWKCSDSSDSPFQSSEVEAHGGFVRLSADSSIRRWSRLPRVALEKVHNHHQYANSRNRELEGRRNVRGRDEPFYQSRNQQHRDAAEYKLDRKPSILDQSVYAAQVFRHQKSLANQEARASRDEDRRQLDRT